MFFVPQFFYQARRTEARRCAHLVPHPVSLRPPIAYDLRPAAQTSVRTSVLPQFDSARRDGRTYAARVEYHYASFRILPVDCQ